METNTTVRDYDEALLKVVRDGIPSLALPGLLSTEAARLLGDPVRHIVKSEDELCDEPNVPAGVETYSDPAFRDPAVFKCFLRRLHERGLLTFRQKCRSKVGVFFVCKKDQFIRMVLDCRVTNSLHRKPPSTRLATSG